MKLIIFTSIVALACSCTSTLWANPNDCFDNKSKYAACTKKNSPAARGVECRSLKDAYDKCLTKVDKQNHKNAANVTLPPGTKVQRNLTQNGKDQYRKETTEGGNRFRHFTGENHRKPETAKKATGLSSQPECRYTITAGKNGIDARVADVAGGPKKSKEYLIRQSDIKNSKRSDCIPYKK